MFADGVLSVPLSLESMKVKVKQSKKVFLKNERSKNLFLRIVISARSNFAFADETWCDFSH
jgi:hypothetical protein